MRPRVTGFSDASLGGDFKSAAYGLWFKADGFQSVAYGRPFKEIRHKAGIDYYEAAALAVLTYEIDNTLGGLKGWTIMLQSDSLNALNAIYGAIPGAKCNPHPETKKNLTGKLIKRGGRVDDFSGPIEVIKGITEGSTLELRWVPGHRRGEGRQWVNRLCDDLAKKAREQGKLIMAQESSLWSGR